MLPKALHIGEPQTHLAPHDSLPLAQSQNPHRNSYSPLYSPKPALSLSHHIAHLTCSERQGE